MTCKNSMCVPISIAITLIYLEKIIKHTAALLDENCKLARSQVKMKILM